MAQKPGAAAVSAPIRRAGIGRFISGGVKSAQRAVSAPIIQAVKKAPAAVKRGVKVSTQPATIKLTSQYQPGRRFLGRTSPARCIGNVISQQKFEPGMDMNAKFTMQLPRGKEACCFEVENINIEQTQSKSGNMSESTMRDVKIPGKKVFDLRTVQQIPGGTRTLCADKFIGTFQLNR
jgi:hypothetical protein